MWFDAISMKIISSAIADISEGLRRSQLWLALAKEDIGDQHRRTVLGPLWLLVNYLVFAGTFIVLFGHSRPHYAAYVSIGMFVWFYIMEVLTLSVSLFVREESFIKGTTLPLTIYVMRLTAQSMLRAAYALIGCIAILAISGTPVTGSWFYGLVGMALIIVATPPAIIVFAVLGAFERDLQFVMQNVLRMGMFLTPVFWERTSAAGVRSSFYSLNPFTHFLDIVRQPVLTGTFPTHAFALSALITLGMWCVAIFLLGRFRKQIAFYL